MPIEAQRAALGQLGLPKPTHHHSSRMSSSNVLCSVPHISRNHTGSSPFISCTSSANASMVASTSSCTLTPSSNRLPAGTTTTSDPRGPARISGSSGTCASRVNKLQPAARGFSVNPTRWRRSATATSK
ncbi:Uu.00g140480.m01.CDS01 [Anthostomella pinea]|uniref:Uu.00g140480.m01.CDS01 n=1 Tax=Anthostomella pinea TaxID=933095 RepID=A0AAI8VQ50_9PEZI|nr:Uu.00g140480.m01.CDS01 [Anthostomella pinea]